MAEYISIKDPHKEHMYLCIKCEEKKEIYKIPVTLKSL